MVTASVSPGSTSKSVVVSNLRISPNSATRCKIPLAYPLFFETLLITSSSRKNKDGSPMVQTRKSGYIGASLHSLRHTNATELVTNKVDPKTVQALLGHSNIQTTLQLYAEAVEENMRAAANVHAAHFATG